MNSSRGGSSDRESVRELREVNEALLVSSIHQHELNEQAQRVAAELRRREAELRSQAEELSRFNRAAVGRESRIIELKEEINALARRHGEPPPYSSEYERAGYADQVGGALRMESAEARTDRGNAAAALEAILCNQELTLRAPRPPDLQKESRALASLLRTLADSPDDVLQELAQKILETLRADSAGVSVLTPDETRFSWLAVAGAWQPYVGGATPRDLGPCGDAFDRDEPLLLRHLERRYEYIRHLTPPVKEALLAPFYVDGKAVGAIWAIAHRDYQFDAEDLRQLSSLSRFASVAYEAKQTRKVEVTRRAAALNLMEDAVRARQAMEEADRELRSSEERYRTLFNSIDEGFCVVEMLFDSEGTAFDCRFLEANSAFEKETGLRDAAGKRMRDLSTCHGAHWLERCGRVALSGEPIRFVDNECSPSGDWYDVYAFRLGAAESRRVAMLFRDITEHRRLTSEAREHARSLSDANRRKDEFLAMLSHELRNPLAAVVNAAQVMRMHGGLSPVQVEAQGMIERQGAQLTRLVDDLLDVSRISTGRIRLRFERVDFRDIVCRAVEATRPQTDRKEQSITTSMPSEPLGMAGDAVRLEQIVVNLLNNASKYTDRGGRIGVTLRRAGDQSVLRVQDNGVGIAPEMLPRIFDWFTQADQSLDRAQGGLGIGLALVQSLVKMHGGRVEVHSAPGVGSEFVVQLPVRSSTPEPAVAGGRSPAASARALKVLVVDDNADAAQSIAMLLEVSGHQSRLAYDGTSALTVAQEFVPDVVLLDIGLPGVDGFEVAKRMRREPTLSHVLLVALTGYGQDADRQRAMEAGFDHHLVKPVDFARIAGILSTAAEKLGR